MCIRDRAISVLASIYLQAVIAASMEEVELFLAPLTARSKVREVLRGLVATRQIHTVSVGHAQHFYVAGTLPAFTVAPTPVSYTHLDVYKRQIQGRAASLELSRPWSFAFLRSPRCAYSTPPPAGSASRSPRPTCI